MMNIDMQARGHLANVEILSRYPQSRPAGSDYFDGTTTQYYHATDKLMLAVHWVGAADDDASECGPAQYRASAYDPILRNVLHSADEWHPTLDAALAALCRHLELEAGALLALRPLEGRVLLRPTPEPRAPKVEWFRVWPAWQCLVKDTWVTRQDWSVVPDADEDLPDAVQAGDVFRYLEDITSCIPVEREGAPYPVAWERVEAVSGTSLQAI